MMCKEILDKVVDGVGGASCVMDIMNVMIDRAWWQYKVGVVWSWVEMDGNLLAEVNHKARILKNQIFILNERNEKEERLLRQASLEHEWRERRNWIDEMKMEDEMSSSPSLEVLTGALYTWRLWTDMLEDDDVEMRETVEHDYLDAIMMDMGLTVDPDGESDFAMIEGLANDEITNMMEIEHEEEGMEVENIDEDEPGDNQAKKPKVENTKEYDGRWRTGCTGPRMPGMLPMVRKGLEVESHPMDKHPWEEGELEEIEHHAGVEENAKPEVTIDNNDIDEDAYYDEGSWYLNNWLPNHKERNIKLDTNGGRMVSIPVLLLKTGDILKQTNLTTISLVRTDMDSFGNKKQGKRQAGSSGRWWPSPCSSRSPPSLLGRQTWSTGRRSKPAEHVTVPENDNIEYVTEKHKHFWSNLYLMHKQQNQDDHHDGGVGASDDILGPGEDIPVNFDDDNITGISEDIFRDMQTVLHTDTADAQQGEGVEVHDHVRREGDGQADQPRVGDVRGEGDEGVHDDDDGGDINLNTYVSKRKVSHLLVRRKYRLRNGVQRDGLLQPTIFNYSTNHQNLLRGGVQNESSAERGGGQRGQEKY
jgi:hypothetical protein